MSYISLGDHEKQAMLAKIGVSRIEDLFQSIPDSIKFKRPLNVPGPLAEAEVQAYFESLAAGNTYPDYLSFLGGGSYAHFIPAVVDYLSSRGEFVSPYTPYQPEISQGTLQVIFEFQSLMCQMTGMDIANASLYDGASGAAEAVLMANRLNRRSKVLAARSLHPQYRETILTYTRNLGIEIEEIGFQDSGQLDLEELAQKLAEDVAVVIFQTPNFFGVVEDAAKISELAHSQNSLSAAVVAETVSLGILEGPGNLGVDIITGEAQSFGLPVSFGGPLLGFMACCKEFVRQLPGRIAGKTKDIEGNEGFVLTLSTREQHIRRERATSNICTNQALCLLRATIFLETLGKEGLREMAYHNLQKSAYAREKLAAIPGVKLKFTGKTFNEFVLELPKKWEEVSSSLKGKGILPGLHMYEWYPELKNCMLVCVTEVHKKEDIDRLVTALQEVMS